MAVQTLCSNCYLIVPYSASMRIMSAKNSDVYLYIQVCPRCLEMNLLSHVCMLMSLVYLDTFIA